MSQNEINPFETAKVAQEWISAIENEVGGSRDNEIYPLLYDWSKGISGLVVEIGAGQGICSSKLNLEDKKYVGIEPSQFLIERAKKLYTEQNKEFIKGLAYDLPLESGIADAAFSIGVWFHILDFEKANKELYRILKPEGQFLIITSNSDTNHVWESFFNGGYKKDGNILSGSTRTSGGTISENILYLHENNEIIESLKRNGFKIDSVIKFGHGKERHNDEGIWVAIRGIKTSFVAS